MKLMPWIKGIILRINDKKNLKSMQNKQLNNNEANALNKRNYIANKS